MKKIRYSAGMKAVVMMLQEVFSVVLVISIVLVSSLFSRSMVNFGELKNENFMESSYYSRLFQGAVSEVLDYIQYQDQFETDGVYNPEKIVNIVAYMNQNIGNNMKMPQSIEDRLRYYLIDLENWSKDYVTVGSQVVSRLYLTEDQVLHQQQWVDIDGKKVSESDVAVHTLRDLDSSLQEMIASHVEYRIGGYYSEDIYQEKETQTTDSDAFTDRKPMDEGTKLDQTTATDNGSDSENGAGSMEPDSENGVGSTGSASDALSKKDAVYHKVIEGKLFELEGEELLTVLTNLELTDAVSTVEGYVLDEKYLTVEGSTILQEFLNGSITLNEMQQAYQSLEYTLNTIGDEITAYKRMVNKYERGNSNLHFWIYQENQNENHTNMEETTVREELLARGKELGSYFYYNKNDINLSTNVERMEEIFYQRLEARNNGHNSVIFVGVDQTFPKEDSFYKAREEYNSLQPWAVSSLVAAVVSLFGCFLSFIYLSIAAGRRTEDEEIHLNWFDRIKTEFLLAGFFVVCVSVVFLIEGFAGMMGGSDVAGMMIMGGGMTFTVIAVFMVFYMSFVRRIKAGTMWSGSFTCWIAKGVEKVVRNWRPSVRVLLFFFMHTVITLMLMGIAVTYYRYRRFGAGLVLIVLIFLAMCGWEAVIFLREGVQRNTIMKGIRQIAGGDLEYEIDTKELKGDNKAMGEAINTIGEGLFHAVDDSMKNERLKADLITNVSHDIKTPLTSIINYVDLLKRENLDNSRAKGYIQVLDAKSQRLKQLTEDLVEASKISSGNVTLQMDRLNFVELVYQTAGEFNEKFEARGLTAITRLPKEPVVILADGRRIWRVIDNLYNNVAKYAMENTRVYVDMEVLDSVVAFSIKNISDQALNIDASELTERFIRGDVSRSTEGSGLGLSIAQNLTKLMGGTFDIYLDGDLFKVTVTFPVAKGDGE